jgi:hypothetical protein
MRFGKNVFFRGSRFFSICKKNLFDSKLCCVGGYDG